MASIANRLLLLLVVTTLAGCDLSHDSGPPVSAAPTVTMLRLPLTQIAAGGPCAGVGHEAPIVLRWNGTQVVGSDGIGIWEIRWPVGFHAVMAPDFREVVTDTGAVFVRANEDINAKAIALRGYDVCYQGRNGIDVFLALAPDPT